MNAVTLQRPRTGPPPIADRTDPGLAAALMGRAALLTDDPDLERIAEDIRQRQPTGAKS